MKPVAIVIYGPPGAGKGTQANLLAWKRGFFHVDTGRLLRGILHDPVNQKNQMVIKERKLNDTGALNTPAWVLSILKKEVGMIANASKSVVFSGSPRTMFEAFGDKRTKGLAQFLSEKYGKKNVHVVHLKVRPEVSQKRNEIRKTCLVCKTSISGKIKIPACPICLGKLVRRRDDSPEIFKERIKEYQTRTFPILKELKKKGYRVIQVNGEKKPPEVHFEIEKKLFD